MTDLPNSQPRPEYVPVSGLAVASMVCGICGIFTLGISSLVGLFLGYRARRETRAGHRRGDGMAITGIVLGWLAVGFALLVIAGAIAGTFVTSGSDTTGDPESRRSESDRADLEATANYTAPSTTATGDTAVTMPELEAPFSYTAVSSGGYHSCAIRIDATLACWGDNSDGQADAPSGSYTAISVGRRHSCAIHTDATLACWGNNDYGQTDAPTGNYVVVSAGRWGSCAIRTDQTPACWLFGGSVSLDVEGALAEYNAATGYTTVSLGYTHLCAIHADKTLACFGDNEFGQADAPLGKFTAVSAGELHSCAVRMGGALACWGNNDVGQTDMPNGTFTAVAAGSLHSCAIRTDSTIACWGARGDWDLGQADAPSGTYTAVSAGEAHSCAIRSDGTLACWGYNENGQADAP